MLRIKKFIKTISFSFTARHKTGHPTIDKDVHLYLVEYLGTKKPMVQKEERFVGFVWLTPEQLKKVKMKPAVYEIVEENAALWVYVVPLATSFTSLSYTPPCSANQ
jgi:hypothetical protein